MYVYIYNIRILNIFIYYSILFNNLDILYTLESHKLAEARSDEKWHPFFFDGVIFGGGWFKRELENHLRSSQMVWFGSNWHETIGEFHTAGVHRLLYLERPTSRREMGYRGCKFEHQNPQVAFCILSAQVCCCYPAKKAMIITATCWHQYCSGTICRQLFWTRVTSLFRSLTRWYWYLKDQRCKV